MPSSSQASVATTSAASGPAFDIDLPNSTDDDVSIRIYFCGRPARSTGVVNLRLLLGDHGYVLTEKRRVSDGEPSRPTDNGSSAADEVADATATAPPPPSVGERKEKKSSQSTYRMCSSDGLPPGCFRVKRDRHYWVMRVGEGAAEQQQQQLAPSTRTTEGGCTTVASQAAVTEAAPSAHAMTSATAGDAADGEDVHRRKHDKKSRGDKAKKKKERKAERRKRSRHDQDSEDEAPEQTAAAPEPTRLGDDANVEEPKARAQVDEKQNSPSTISDNSPLSEIFSAVEAAAHAVPAAHEKSETAVAAAPPPTPTTLEALAGGMDDIVGDVEATLGDLFLSSSSQVGAEFQATQEAEPAVEATHTAEARKEHVEAVAEEGDAVEREENKAPSPQLPPSKTRRANKKNSATIDESKTLEKASDAEASHSTASARNPRRRGRPDAYTAAEAPTNANTLTPGLREGDEVSSEKADLVAHPPVGATPVVQASLSADDDQPLWLAEKEKEADKTAALHASAPLAPPAPPVIAEKRRGKREKKEMAADNARATEEAPQSTLPIEHSAPAPLSAATPASDAVVSEDPDKKPSTSTKGSERAAAKQKKQQPLKSPSPPARPPRTLHNAAPRAPAASASASTSSSPSVADSPPPRLATSPPLPVPPLSLQGQQQRQRDSSITMEHKGPPQNAVHEATAPPTLSPGNKREQTDAQGEGVDASQEKTLKAQQKQQEGEAEKQRRSTVGPSSAGVKEALSASASRRSRRAAAVAAALRTPPRSPLRSSQDGVPPTQLTPTTAQAEMPSPPIRPPLSPRGLPAPPPQQQRTSSAEHYPVQINSNRKETDTGKQKRASTSSAGNAESTPPQQQQQQQGQRKRSRSGAETPTTPTLLYSNRSSGVVTSLHPPPPLPQQQQQQHQQHQSQAQPEPLAATSTGGGQVVSTSDSSSTRLAPLTSPHLRQHQQQFAQRGSSGGNGGSLQFSETNSYNMMPQESPALGFTQVHNTLAEEFSLDPSETGSSSTASEYLYDVEG